MSAKRRPDETDDPLEPMRQDATRCRILGIDEWGHEHIHDQDRNRIVVLDHDGIEEQYDLDEIEQDAADWMHYVRERRGWAKEQWTGYRWGETLWGDGNE